MSREGQKGQQRVLSNLESYLQNEYKQRKTKPQSHKTTAKCQNLQTDFSTHESLKKNAMNHKVDDNNTEI